MRERSKIMKITEMNNCIEKMRKCYKFEDDKTEIRLANPVSFDDTCVYISTRDENGTKIEMTKAVGEKNENINTRNSAKSC